MIASDVYEECLMVSCIGCRTSYHLPRRAIPKAVYENRATYCMVCGAKCRVSIKGDCDGNDA